MQGALWEDLGPDMVIYVNPFPKVPGGGTRIKSHVGFGGQAAIGPKDILMGILGQGYPVGIPHPEHPESEPVGLVWVAS